MALFVNDVFTFFALRIDMPHHNKFKVVEYCFDIALLCTQFHVINLCFLHVIQKLINFSGNAEISICDFSDLRQVVS